MLHAIKSMSDAIARSDGKAIKFTLTTHHAGDFEFECPPEAIPIIVARLTGALEQIATIHDPSDLHRSNPIVVSDHKVVGTYNPPTIVLKLFPTKNCPIPFALTPDRAEDIALALGGAANKIGKPGERPRPS
jgi:hypothetical protein